MIFSKNAGKPKIHFDRLFHFIAAIFFSFRHFSNKRKCGRFLCRRGWQLWAHHIRFIILSGRLFDTINNKASYCNGNPTSNTRKKYVFLPSVMASCHRLDDNETINEEFQIKVITQRIQHQAAEFFFPRSHRVCVSVEFISHFQVKE